MSRVTEVTFNVIVMKKRFLLLAVVMLTYISLSAQVLVIPDVHGRTFWMDAVDENPELPVVFLGDYLDPYPDEDISNEEALLNFKAILEFKKSQTSTVTLLIGNHDVQYIDTFYQFSRKDTLNAERIHQIYMDNFSLFAMASCKKINGMSYLFTHAGILEPWLKRHFPSVSSDAECICNALNEKIKDPATFGNFLDNALMDVGKSRGGDAQAGSCIWADVDEHRDSSLKADGVYQVFGHTQQEEKALFRQRYADLDCRKAYIIYPNGKIKPTTGM